MLQITLKRRHVVVLEHRLCWDSLQTPGAAYAFRCDAQGHITMSELSDTAKANLDHLQLDGMGGRYVGPHIDTYRHSYWTAAEGICKCGFRVILPSGGDTDCGCCGRIYSCTGQELAPRSQWGEETGETLADIYSSYDPEEVL